MNISDMDSASMAMAEDYMLTPHLIRIAFISHIHKLMDRENLGHITYEEFCNYMAISSIVANKAVMIANDQKKPLAH